MLTMPQHHAQSMPHSTRNPVEKLWIPRIREHAPILSLLCPLRLLPQLSLLLLLPAPLFLLAPLSLRAVVQQERQRAAQREYNKRLQDVRIDVVGVVVIIVIGIRVVKVPLCKLGFEEGGEPFC
jgi:hypothetical protein